MINRKEITVLDCTLRDGGYYNSWDFPKNVVNQYLKAMKAAGVDVVEVGFRFIDNFGFKGASAFTTDDYMRSLEIPDGIRIAVMVNGGDLLKGETVVSALEQLFPETAADSPASLVRFACHFHEFKKILPAVDWLVERGYEVGFNLMQIAARSEDEVRALSRSAAKYPISVLYFADSMGSMSPDHATQIVNWLRDSWDGDIGIHTHDNLGLALSNTKGAIAAGATWVDGTVTGMGRGPGNARTEELVIELTNNANIVPLLVLIREYFAPMKHKFQWGTNPYYFLCGKYGIHPSYVQQMMQDNRYSEEDILSVIENLRNEKGKKFSADSLKSARENYKDAQAGNWCPKEVFDGREVLILGTGASVNDHNKALEAYIRRHNPIVLALNTQDALSEDLITFRVACHHLRLLADKDFHASSSSQLIAPVSQLPETVRREYANMLTNDFGIKIADDEMSYSNTGCTLPNSLVAAYAFAIAASGGAKTIQVAGFDGYSSGDARNNEMNEILSLVGDSEHFPEIISITPTKYNSVTEVSVYAL
ncbi:MAG: aldolase catalytic domain-containing protein [Litorimonas sp.]